MSRTKRFLTGFVFVLGLGLAFFAGWVRLPYYSLGPGPAREVQPLISVSGAQEYPSQGKLIMTTVRFRGLSAVGMLVAWLDPHQAVVSRGNAVPAGRDGRAGGAAVALADGPEQDRRDRRGAAAADRLPEGSRRRSAARVRVSGMPAEGKLFAGDVVESIDGTPVHSADEASAALDAVPVKEPITFEVHGRRARRTRSRSRGSGACPTSTSRASAST